MVDSLPRLVCAWLSQPPGWAIPERPWLFPVALGVIVALAAAARFAACLNQLWLDEIWTLLWFVRRAGSIGQIFTRFRHDNNHWLNTLWMYAMGPDVSALRYRMLSLVTGTVTVGVVGLIVRPEGTLPALVAALLCALSFILIQYSSEARGYGAATCFAVLMFYLAQWYFQEQSVLVLAGLWLSIMLGLLAHLTFLYAYLALVVWSVVRLAGHNSCDWSAVMGLLHLHAGPMIFGFVLFAVAVRGPGSIGILRFSYRRVVAQTIGWILGTPTRGRWSEVTLVGAMAVIGAQLYHGQQEGRDDFVFYAMVILVAPALLLSAHRVTGRGYALFPRYFVICIPFFLILVARFLCRWGQASAWAGVAVGMVLLLMTLAHGRRFARLWKLGRGSYIQLIGLLAQNARGSQIVVGSDNDFRCGLLLEYYAKYLPRHRALHFSRHEDWPSLVPDWLVLTTQPIRRLLGERIAMVSEPVPAGQEQGYRCVLAPIHPASRRLPARTVATYEAMADGAFGYYGSGTYLRVYRRRRSELHITSPMGDAAVVASVAPSAPKAVGASSGKDIVCPPGPQPLLDQDGDDSGD